MEATGKVIWKWVSTTLLALVDLTLQGGSPALPAGRWQPGASWSTKPSASFWAEPLAEADVANPLLSRTQAQFMLERAPRAGGIDPASSAPPPAGHNLSPQGQWEGHFSEICVPFCSCLGLER